MNWFDIFVVILLLRTSYVGFKNGLSAEIYKAAGLVLSGLAAFYFYQKAALSIGHYALTLFTDEQLNIIAFLIILFTAMLVFKFIFMFVQKIVQLNFAKGFNTAAGMVSGLGRGILIACIAFVILQWSAMDYIKQSVQDKSFSGIYIIKINSQIKPVVSIILGGKN